MTYNATCFLYYISVDDIK